MESINKKDKDEVTIEKINNNLKDYKFKDYTKNREIINEKPTKIIMKIYHDLKII